MWPWRRKQEDPAPVPAPAPVVPPRPPADQWRLVAPIQRVVGDDILANPVQRFSGSLSAWQDPRFVGSLGHGVSAGEPSGTIGEFARPSGVQPDHPAGSLPSMPVATPQPERPSRPIAFTVSRLAEPVDEPSPVEAAPQPGTDAAPPPSASAAPGLPAAAPAEVPSPEQPAAPTLGATAPPVQDPGGTPEADDSGDAVQRMTSSDTVQRTAGDGALPLASAPSPSVQRMAAGTASASTQQPAGAGAASVQRATDTAATTDSAPSRDAGASVQRAGGDATSAASGVQRVADTLAQRSAETPVQRAADEAASAVQRAAEASGPAVQRDGDLPLPHAVRPDAPVQRAADPTVGDLPVQRSADAAQRSADGDAPLLNAPIQRALDDDEPGVQRVAAETPGAVAHGDHFHLPLQRSTAPEQPRRLGLGAPIEPAVQRSFDDGVSLPIGGGFGPGDGMPPAVQRLDAGGDRMPSVRRSEAGGDTMPLAAQRRDVGGDAQGFAGADVQRFAGGDVQRFAGGDAPGFAGGDGPGFAGGDGMPAVQRLDEGGAGPDGGFEAIRPVPDAAPTLPGDVPAAPSAGTGPDSPAMPLSTPPSVQRLGLGPALEDGSALLSAPTLSSSPIASALPGGTPDFSGATPAASQPTPAAVQPTAATGPAVQRTRESGAEPELPVAVTHGGAMSGGAMSGRALSGGPAVPVRAPSAPTASSFAAPVLPVVSRLVGDRPLRPALADLPAAQAPATGASIASGPSPADLPSVPVAQLVAEPPAGAPHRTAVPLQTYSTSDRGIGGGGLGGGALSGDGLSGGPGGGLGGGVSGLGGLSGGMGGPGDGAGFGAMPTVSGPGAASVQRSAMPAAASPAMRLLSARPAAETPSSSPYADPNYFDAPPITVSRQVTVSASADNPVPTVSRAEDAATPDPGPPAEAAPAAPAAPGAAGGAAAQQPDELVKKLFDPLLRRLKAELRLDRERRGSLTDLRH